MRQLFLMVAFGFGCVFLLPRPARSLDDCVACDCKEMKAWRWVNPNTPAPYGLRKQDPNDPKKTVPVEHVPDLGLTLGRYLSTAADVGTRTSQGVNYSIYQYTKSATQDCKASVSESGDSIIRLTFANAEDWDYFDTTSMQAQTHHLCREAQGGGGGPGGDD